MTNKKENPNFFPFCPARSLSEKLFPTGAIFSLTVFRAASSQPMKYLKQATELTCRIKFKFYLKCRTSLAIYCLDTK